MRKRGEDVTKFAKRDASIENIAPFIANRIGKDSLEKIANAHYIELATVSIIAGLYDRKYWEREAEVK